MHWIRNNLLIAVVTVPASIALGVAMASFSHSLGKKGKTITRIGFIYPTFIPLVAAANIWMFIYTPIYGLLGYINPEAAAGKWQDSDMGNHCHADLEAGRLSDVVLHCGTERNIQGSI